MSRTRILTAKKLVSWLLEEYGDEYSLTEEEANKVLEICDKEYDLEFSEEELISTIEDVLYERETKEISELDLLNEYLEEARYDLSCYSMDLVCSKPRETHKREWGRSKQIVKTLERMIKKLEEGKFNV